MRKIFAVATAVMAFVGLANAAVPRPEQLLPSDTLFVVSIPDWATAVSAFDRSSIGRLWRDIAFKPARDKLMERFSESVTDPLEKELGVALSEYSELLRGQVTFAVTQGIAGENSQPGVMLLIDTQDASERLRMLLGQLKQKWVESGRQLKSERIRDVEFSTLIVRGRDVSGLLGQAFQESGSRELSKNGGAAAGDEFEITIGQSETLLLIANSTKAMERILIRQSGGLITPLAEQPEFQIARSEPFRAASGFGWINFAPVYEKLASQASLSGGGAAANNPLAPRLDKILAATGLDGLKSIAFRLNSAEDGFLAELFLGVPRSGREGIFKALVAEAKDSSPPPFVPANALKFSRWRLDGRKAWDTFESMLTSVSPEFGALVQMGMATAGKDKDPNFDLRRNFLGNLGDDFIVYEKAPRSATLEELNAGPALFLVGSPNPEELARAVKAASSLLPIPASDSKTDEREFLGRKVYSIPLPSMPSVSGATPVRRSFSFAAASGYLVLSTDVAMLEEFIRGENSGGKRLRETNGLGEAAQRVDGMAGGFFGYENQRENLRVTLETLKNDMARIEQMFALGSGGRSGSKSISDWIDLSLLPPFETISKYFHFIVYSGGTTSQGLTWKLFAPAPPP